MAVTITPTGEMYDELGRPLFSRAQQVAPPQQQVVVAPTQQADYSPVKIAPDAPTAAESQSIKLPDHNDPAFHQSLGRRVLNAVAAGLAGASGGPRAGIETAESLDPYNRAMETYKNKVAEQKRQLGIEDTQYQRGLKPIQLGIERGKAQAGDQYRAVKLQQDEEKIKNTAKENESKDKMRNASIAYKQWQQANPKKDDLQYILSLKPEDQEAALEVIRQEHEAKQKTTQEIEDEAEARAKGSIKGGYSPTAASAKADTAGKVAGAQETARETAKANAPISNDEKTTVDSFVQRGLANPDTIHDLAKEVPKKLQAKFWSSIAASDVKIPRQLTPKLQETVTSAKTAINHANLIRTLIQDPDISKSLGPIAGRLTEGGNVVGKSVYNSGPAAQKEAQLLGLLRYLITFEASSTSGTRPSWQLIQFLKGTSPGMRMDKDKVNGALDAVISSAGNRLQGIFSPSNEGAPVAKPKLQIKWQ